MTRRRRILAWTVRIVLAVVVTVFALACATTDRFRAFGGAPSDKTLARMHASKQWHGDRFENAEPTELMKAGTSYSRWVKLWLAGEELRVPNCPLPVEKPQFGSKELKITWFGHSSTLIEIDGVNILTDPNWSERASPSTLVGPSRFHPPPIPIAELPRIDAVVISHEHYDHLDMRSVRALALRGIEFHVPLGVSGHLSAWGVSDGQIVEHDWWDAKTIKGVRITSTPARHFNGRGLPGRVGALWTSWSIVGPRHRVFFSGDTGMTEAFAEIAKREGPFDVALLEIGQHHPSWGDIHLGPIGALDAQAVLHARTLFPIHWSTFALAFHAWSEPAETMFEEGSKRGAVLATPRLGESWVPGQATSPWWRALPPIADKCP